MRPLAAGVLSVLVNVACAQAPVVLAPAPMPPTGERLRIFISDLHLGVGHIRKNVATGRYTEGPWHPTEDFRWAAEFKGFLDQIKNEAKGRSVAADLIIVGDFLELWQSPVKVCSLEPCTEDERAGRIRKDCEYLDAKGVEKEDLGCTEADALERARRALGAHEQTLREIGDFANADENRVVIIVGNHDAALVFDRVKTETLKAIGARPDRVWIATEGFWLSPDGLIFAEHGHQIEGDVNAYEALPASCVDAGGKRVACDRPGVHLKRPWGENFVQKYYEQYEAQYPIIDNVSELGEGVTLGILAAGIGGTLDALAKGFKFLLLQQSRAQMVAALGKDEAQPLPYDFEAIRAQGRAFLATSILGAQTDDQVRREVQQAVQSGTLAVNITDFSDEELRTLCDVREDARRVQKRRAETVTIEACPRKGSSSNLGAGDDATLGAIATNLFTTERGRFQRRFSALRNALGNSGRPTQDFQLYVYAHTHLAHSEIKPFGSSASWSPAMFNTGAWQHVATPAQLEKIREAEKLPAWKALLAITPEKLPPCFSFVLVEPYKAGERDKISARMNWWAKTGSTWSMLEACPPYPQ
jgi:UDP-2,3-diacylglucosamine pyrophosphatase LpxH